MRIVKVTRQNQLTWPSQYRDSGFRFNVGQWLAIDANGMVRHFGRTKTELLAQMGA